MSRKWHFVALLVCMHNFVDYNRNFLFLFAHLLYDSFVDYNGTNLCCCIAYLQWRQLQWLKLAYLRLLRLLANLCWLYQVCSSFEVLQHDTYSVVSFTDYKIHFVALHSLQCRLFCWLYAFLFCCITCLHTCLD